MAMVECRVARGAIARELMVYVEGEEREYESWADPGKVEVPSELDAEASVPGYVHIRVVRRDDEHGRALIELPQEVVMGGRRIWVATSKLKTKD